MSEEDIPQSEPPKVNKDFLLSLFDKEGKNLFQRFASMCKGFKQPKDSIEFKEAMIELQRLGAPAAAIIIPTILIIIMACVKFDVKQPETTIEATMIDPEPVEKLEEPPPEEKPPELEEIVDVEAPVVDIDAPVTTSDVQSPQPREFDSVQMNQNPIVMKGIFGSRDPGTRGSIIGRYGGGNLERCVIGNLRYLAKVQNENGSWGTPNNRQYRSAIGVTSIVLLTYLAHAETPSSPEFGKTVEKAIKFLLSKQKADGNFESVDTENYSHPIAVYALAEAYAMTKIPDIKAALDKALPILIKGQTAKGGFGYKLDPSTDRIDSSYMGWCVQALKAAKVAGMTTPGLLDALKRSVKGILVLQNKQGGFLYVPGQNNHTGLTAVGALTLQFLGEGDSAEAKKAFEFMKSWKPSFRNTIIKGGATQYYCYYAAQVRFFLGESDPSWKAWYKEMGRVYLAAYINVPKEKSGYKDHNGVPRDIGYWGTKNNGRNVGAGGNDLEALRNLKDTRDNKRLGYDISTLTINDNNVDMGEGNGGDRAMANCMVALQLMVIYRNTPMSKDALMSLHEEEKEVISDGGSEIKIEGGDDL